MKSPKGFNSPVVLKKLDKLYGNQNIKTLSIRKSHDVPTFLKNKHDYEIKSIKNSKMSFK